MTWKQVGAGRPPPGARIAVMNEYGEAAHEHMR
jgi:hypothetical protein